MRDRFLRNWHLKLLAVGLAFAIWISVTGENRVLQVLEVPLDLVLRDDSVLKVAGPATVAVSLRGPESQVRRLDRGSLEIRVDLRDAAPGPRTVPLSARNLLGLRADMEVVKLEPDRLQIEIERRLRKSVPVVPSFLGEPSPLHSLYGSRVRPESVAIEGPISLVEGLDRLSTDPIRLDGRTAPFVAEVGAVLQNPGVRILGPGILQVEVHVDVSPIRRSFHDVPVVVTGKASGAATARPRTVRVVATGPPSLLERLRADQIRVIADLGEAAPDAEGLVVPLKVEFLDVPDPELPRLAVRSLTPPRVTVRRSSRRLPA